MLEWLMYVIHVLRCWFVSHQTLAVENLALRSQLALFEHQVISGKRKKPGATPAFRQLWVVLSRCCKGWEQCSPCSNRILSSSGTTEHFVCIGNTSQNPRDVPPYRKMSLIPSNISARKTCCGVRNEFTINSSALRSPMFLVPKPLLNISRRFASRQAKKPGNRGRHSCES